MAGSASTEDTGADDEDDEGDEDEDVEEGESWTERIVRAIELAVGAAKKAGRVDWVEEQRGAGNGNRQGM